MHRRDFLRLSSAGLAAAQLPLHLTLARSALAQEAGQRPKRVLFVFTPHGGGPSFDKPNLWQPDVKDGALVLNKLSAPLEKVKQHILFLDGLSMYNNPHGLSDGHKQGNRKALTANGPDSLDIVIGDHFKGKTPFSSVQMGVMPNRFSHHNTPAYRGGSEVPFLDDPRALYKLLFAGAQPASPTAGPNPNVSILSGVAAELTRLRKQLGSVEKERLDQHADSLSQLEKRLTNVPTAGCGMPMVDMEGVPERANDESKIGELSRAMQQIAAQALACDLTRSMHFAFGHEANGVKLPGFSKYDHEASHDDLKPEGEYERYRLFWAKQLCDLLTVFSTTPDGSGTLLENTLIVHYSEIGHSNSHDFNRVPFFLAGGKNVGLQVGKKVSYPFSGKYDPNGLPHSRLLASIGQVMGLSMTKFGDGDGVLANANEIFGKTSA